MLLTVLLSTVVANFFHHVCLSFPPPNNSSWIPDTREEIFKEAFVSLNICVWIRFESALNLTYSSIILLLLGQALLICSGSLPLTEALRQDPLLPLVFTFALD